MPLDMQNLLINAIDYFPPKSIFKIVETVDGIATIDLTDGTNPEFEFGFRGVLATVEKNDEAASEFCVCRLESVANDFSSVSIKVVLSDNPATDCADGTKVHVLVIGQ